VKQIRDAAAQAEFEKELEILCQVKPGFAVKFFGVALLKDRTVGLVMEFCPGGALSEALQLRKSLLDAPQLLQCALHIAYGLSAIHQLDIIHRDIACRNVLVAANGTAKLADFGLARRLDAGNDVYMSTSAVAVRWTAPEVLTSSQVTKASDIYSLGITYQELFAFAELPFEHIPTNAKVIEAVVDGERPVQPDSCPDNVYAYIGKLWAANPLARPQVSAVATKLEKLLAAETQAKKAPTEKLYDFVTPQRK
jgi:serine/threonine protein kinase